MSAFMLFKVLAVMANQGKNLACEQIAISTKEEDFLFSADSLPHEGQNQVRAEVAVTRKNKVISSAKYLLESKGQVICNELVEEELKNQQNLKNVDAAFQTLLYKFKK